MTKTTQKQTKTNNFQKINVNKKESENVVIFPYASCPIFLVIKKLTGV